MITAKTKKRGEYYHAVLVVESLTYKVKYTYTSRDMFVTKQTALKQAEWWKRETLDIGQVINF